MGMRITCYTSYMGACADVGPSMVHILYMFISHLYHLIVVNSFYCVHFVEMHTMLDLDGAHVRALQTHKINLSTFPLHLSQYRSMHNGRDTRRLLIPAPEEPSQSHRGVRAAGAEA